MNPKSESQLSADIKEESLPGLQRLLESMDPGPPAPLEPQPQKGQEETELPSPVILDPNQSSPDNKVPWPVLLLSGSVCSEEDRVACAI